MLTKAYQTTAYLKLPLHKGVFFVKDLCRHDIEAQTAIDSALQRPGGNPNGNNQHTKEVGTVDNIHGSSIERPTGTSRAAAIRRLRKDAPELLAADYLAKVATPLNPNGTNQHSEKVGLDNNQTLKGGTDPEYLTSRIARDRPDILERMKQGEFRSVRAAGIEAGVTGPIPSSLARDQLIIKNTPAVGKHGTNRFSEDRVDGGKLYKTQGGNSLKYQAGRLKRDRPDLAEKVEIGNMSLRAATDEAGNQRALFPKRYHNRPLTFPSSATGIIDTTKPSF